MQEKNKKNFTDFGARLRFVREELELSQKEFAIKLGFASYKAISRFEQGERLPNAEALLRLAALGNFNFHYLITGQPSPDGEAWRESYGELFRMYNADGSLWIDRLKGEIADLTKEITGIEVEGSGGGKIDYLTLEFKKERRRIRQNQLDQIKEHLKQATDRLGGIHIEY